MHETHFGSPRNRVDGRLKVTGAAPYAGEVTAPDLAYGYVVSGAIAKGTITVKNLADNKSGTVSTKFVFIGAGGGALPLLEKTGIPEAKGFGGVPVVWMGDEIAMANDPHVLRKRLRAGLGRSAAGMTFSASVTL